MCIILLYTCIFLMYFEYSIMGANSLKTSARGGNVMSSLDIHTQLKRRGKDGIKKEGSLVIESAC